MDNNPYQPPQPQQPWENNSNNNQPHDHNHHEGHHPHHGHHHDHHDHQNHNPSFEPYESQSPQPQQPGQPEAYPTHIPPEVLEHHAQYVQHQAAAPQFISPTPPYQPPVEQYLPPTPPAPPAPEQSYASMLPGDDIQPVAVVQALSVRGVEYWMMTMTLYLGAAGILGILLAFINGGISFEVLAFPVSLLLVCLPVFSYLFLRLKKAELINPKLRLDPSKRKLTQFTQIITFVICLFDIVGIVFAILASISGHGFGPLWKYVLNSLVVLLVAGGILYYYWNDEHTGRN